LIDILKLSLKL